MKDPIDAGASDAHERLYLSCKRLVAEKGFSGATTREIAKLAGSSESQLFKHFGGKEEVLLALFTDGWRQINEKATRETAGEEDPLIRMHKLMRVVTEVLISDNELEAIFLLEGRRIGKNGHVLLMSEEYYKFIAVVDRLLEDAQRQGLFQGCHIQALRSALFGAAEALLRDMLLARRIGFPASYNLDDVLQIFWLLLCASSRAEVGRGRRSKRPALSMVP